eukprot:PhM_4_TR10100/c2_g1_i2/m.65673
MNKILRWMYHCLLQPNDSFETRLRKQLIATQPLLAIVNLIFGVITLVYTKLKDDGKFHRHSVPTGAAASILVSIIAALCWVWVRRTKKSPDLLMLLALSGWLLGFVVVLLSHPTFSLHIMFLTCIMICVVVNVYPLKIGIVCTLLSIVNSYNMIIVDKVDEWPLVGFEQFEETVSRRIMTEIVITFVSGIAVVVVCVQRRAYENNLARTTSAVFAARQVAQHLVKFETRLAWRQLLRYKRDAATYDEDLGCAFFQIVQNMEMYRPFLPHYLATSASASASASSLPAVRAQSPASTSMSGSGSTMAGSNPNAVIRSPTTGASQNNNDDWDRTYGNTSAGALVVPSVLRKRSAAPNALDPRSLIPVDSEIDPEDEDINSHIVLAPLRHIVRKLAVAGYDDLDENTTRREKEASVLGLLLAFVGSIVGLIVWSTSVWCLTFFILCSIAMPVFYVTYVSSKEHMLIRHCLVVLNTLLPIVLCVSRWDKCGALLAYDGVWFTPQCLLIVSLRYMGGTVRHAVCALALYVAELLIIIAIEVVQFDGKSGCGDSDDRSSVVLRTGLVACLVTAPITLILALNKDRMVAVVVKPPQRRFTAPRRSVAFSIFSGFGPGGDSSPRTSFAGTADLNNEGVPNLFTPHVFEGSGSIHVASCASVASKNRRSSRLSVDPFSPTQACLMHIEVGGDFGHSCAGTVDLSPATPHDLLRIFTGIISNFVMQYSASIMSLSGFSVVLRLSSHPDVVLTGAKRILRRLEQRSTYFDPVIALTYQVTRADVASIQSRTYWFLAGAHIQHLRALASRGRENGHPIVLDEHFSAAVVPSTVTRMNSNDADDQDPGLQNALYIPIFSDDMVTSSSESSTFGDRSQQINAVTPNSLLGQAGTIRAPDGTLPSFLVSGPSGGGNSTSTVQSGQSMLHPSIALFTPQSTIEEPGTRKKSVLGSLSKSLRSNNGGVNNNSKRVSVFGDENNFLVEFFEEPGSKGKDANTMGASVHVDAITTGDDDTRRSRSKSVLQAMERHMAKSLSKSQRSHPLSSSGQMLMPPPMVVPIPGARTPPPNVPEEVWNVWRQCDLDGNGVLDAEETWNILRLLGIPLTAERYFEFLQAVDTDGDCTISLDELVVAFDSILSGIVLKRNIGMIAEEWRRDGRDSLAMAKKAWKTVDKSIDQELGAEGVAEVLAALEIDCKARAVELLLKELDSENKPLSMEDFLVLFGPKVPEEELEFQTHIEAVKRSLYPRDRVYATEEQHLADAKIVHEKRTQHLLEVFLFVYTLYILAEVPVVNAFYFRENIHDTFVPRKCLELVLDLLPMYWIVRKLWAPRDVGGQMSTKPAVVREAYFRSFEVWLDVVIFLPLDIVGLSLGNDYYPEMFRLTKLLLIFYINSFYDAFMRSARPMIASILKTFMWWIVMVHAFGCVFLAVASGEPDTYVEEIIGIQDFRSEEHPLLLLYAHGFDFSIKLMVGLSRGEPVPQSDGFTVLSLCVVFVGVVVFSVIVAKVVNALNVRDAKALFDEKIDQVHNFAHYSNVPEDVHEELKDFYRHMHRTLGSTELDYNPLDDIPMDLDVQIRCQCAYLQFRDVRVFRPLLNNGPVLHELYNMTRPSVIMPEEWVCRKGQPIFEIYMITSGHLVQYVDGNDMLCTLLGVGQSVNDYGLMHNLLCIYDVQGHPVRHTNVLVLSKESFSHILHNFPELTKDIAQRVRRRIRSLLRGGESASKSKSHAAPSSGSPNASEIDASGSRASADPEGSARRRTNSSGKDMEGSGAAASSGRRTNEDDDKEASAGSSLKLDFEQSQVEDSNENSVNNKSTKSTNNKSTTSGKSGGDGDDAVSRSTFSVTPASGPRRSIFAARGSVFTATSTVGNTSSRAPRGSIFAVSKLAMQRGSVVRSNRLASFVVTDTLPEDDDDSDNASDGSNDSDVQDFIRKNSMCGPDASISSVHRSVVDRIAGGNRMK